MLAALVDALACPVCDGPLTQDEQSLRCVRGHSYDIARQGHVTLRAGSGPRHSGDDAAMVSARDELLTAGRYGGLAQRIADLAAESLVESAGTSDRALVVDAGGGTGYYLTRVLDHLGGSSPPGRTEPLGLVLDASPYALRRAATAHPAVGAVGCDLWQRWPLRRGVATLVLGIFAPRNGIEARRVLAPGGSLLVVTPANDHLTELVTRLGLLGVDDQKDERLSRSFDPYLIRRSAEPYTETLRLSRREVGVVVGMGPSARHLDPDTLSAAVAQLPEQIDVTLSVVLTRWTRP